MFSIAADLRDSILGEDSIMGMIFLMRFFFSNVKGLYGWKCARLAD